MNEDYSFEYSKLLGKIKETHGTQNKFSLALGISRTSLSLRLNNRVEFSQNEIKKACSLLGLNENEMPKYFFTEKVQKSEHTNKAG